MAFTDVNIGAAADDGTGNPLRTAFQKTNANFANAQVQLNAKADSQETQDTLAGQQLQLNEKASLASFDNLTQRVQENATKITEIGNAAKPSELAGAGLKADAGDAKLEVKTGAGLSIQGGAVAVDAAGLAGAGLQAQDGKLTPNIGTGLEVSTDNQLQISGWFAAEVNGKLDAEDFEGALLEIANLLAAKVEVSAKASAADIQNGTAGKWVDAAGLKDSRVAFCAVGGVAQTIPYNAATRITGLSDVNFNLGNGYADSKFTVPVAGIYEIKASFVLTSTSGSAVTSPWALIELRKNASGFKAAYIFNAARSDGFCAIAGNWLVELAAGDALELYLTQVVLSAGVIIGAGTPSFFAGHLVR